MSLFPEPYKYVIDSSALFDLKNNYPPTVFKTVWDNFHQLCDNKSIISVKEVYNEIRKGLDWLVEWSDERKDFFLTPCQEELIYLGELQTKYPNLVDYLSDKPNADPFVIACAKQYNLTIIQHEKYNKDKQKIPTVAISEGIKCVRLVELFEGEGWTF